MKMWIKVRYSSKSVNIYKKCRTIAVKDNTSGKLVFKTGCRNGFASYLAIPVNNVILAGSWYCSSIGNEPIHWHYGQ